MECDGDVALPSDYAGEREVFRRRGCLEPRDLSGGVGQHVGDGGGSSALARSGLHCLWCRCVPFSPCTKSIDHLKCLVGFPDGYPGYRVKVMGSGSAACYPCAMLCFIFFSQCSQVPHAGSATVSLC